jgi:hypothetical protein
MAATTKPPYEISHAVNNNDHGPIIISVAAVLLVCSSLVLILRLWMRWPWKAMLGGDDYCTIVAHVRCSRKLSGTSANISQVLAVAQTCIIFGAVSVGLGKRGRLLDAAEHTSAEKVGRTRASLKFNITHPSQLAYAADILFVLATWLSRLGVAMLFLRLCANRSQVRRIRYFVFAVIAVSVASVLVSAIREQPLTPWRSALRATTFYRWIAIGTLGIVVEILLTGLSIVLVWGLQMQPKDKLRVFSGFAARLVVAAPIVIRLVSLHDNVNAKDFTWAFTMPAMWAQLELHLSLVGSTIPCLRIFLKSFNTGYLGMAVEQLDPTGTMIATKGDSYNMSKLRSNGSDNKFGNPTQAQVSKAGKTTSRVTHGRDEDHASSLSDRSDRGIFVRQTVNVAYDH